MVLISVDHSWSALVHKNFDIERACVELEAELRSLKEQARMRLVDPETPCVLE